MSSNRSKHSTVSSTNFICLESSLQHVCASSTRRMETKNLIQHSKFGKGVKEQSNVVVILEPNVCNDYECKYVMCDVPVSSQSLLFAVR